MLSRNRFYIAVGQKITKFIDGANLLLLFVLSVRVMNKVCVLETPLADKGSDVRVFRRL